MHLWPEEPVRQGGRIKISTIIETPGKDRQELWFTIPENQEAGLSLNADPFVLGSIYLIMQSDYDVQVHGNVSPSLLCNLEDFQAAWATWMPELKKVTIKADNEIEPCFSQTRNESVVAFSGGVDSCFTAYSQAQAYVRPNSSRLAAGIMIQGFDIPLDQPDTFASAMKRSQALLSSLDLELIPIATNYKELGADWIHSFGAATASCLALFSGRFNVGFISQGLTYNDFHLLHEGSNPLTDPLLSSDTFKIVPGGTEFERASKIFAMRDWKEFLHYLRVCHKGPQKDRNCCECEKCMRNILTFRALGLGLPPCFIKDIDDNTIASLGLGAGFLPEIRYGELADMAQANGVQGEWIKIIEKKLTSIKRKRQIQNSIIMRAYRQTRHQVGRLIAPLRQINN